jgi:hypothetical protein
MLDLAQTFAIRLERRCSGRSAQVLLHLPDHAGTGNYKSAVDVVRERDGAITVFAFQLTQPAECEQSLCEIVEILSVPIRGLADPDATRSAEH